MCSLLLYACTADKKGVSNTRLQLSHKDSLQVIEKSLVKFLMTAEYPKSYRSGPLQIFHSEVVRLDSTLNLSGNPYVLLLKGFDIHAYMQKIDIYNPIPYAEIVEFKVSQNRVTCMIIFRGSGQIYETFLNDKLMIDSVSADGQI
ncbi:MAG: hypothetical protein V4687_18080 [Bacteroidota bacterium]